MRIAPPKTDRLHIRMSDDERRKLNELAVRDGKSASDTIRSLIEKAHRQAERRGEVST
jgi:hypothetical protein